jgi:hypothetical protein
VHDTRDDRFPVTLCAERARGLRLLVGDLGTEHRPDRLRVFDIKEPASAPDLLFGGSKEMLARAIHDGYRRMQERQGHTRETNRALVPWNELPGHLQESNRQQADHVGQKLAAVGCGIVPLSDWNATLVSFTSDEANTMARMEHGDDWESLPEDVKEIDRHTVRDLPRFLALVGFYVYRLAGPDSVVAAGSGVRDLK